MIEIISCKECNNIITTSENICFYTKRYDEIMPSFKIKEKEKIMFIGDEEEIDQIRNAPNEFEFLITNSEIKCKNCGVLLGNLIFKEKDIYLGTILTSKMTSMRLKNEKKDKEINIYSQKENECLTTIKELRNLCDVVYAYSKDITLSDVGNIKAQIEEISKRLDKTKMSNLLLDKKDSQ